MLRVKGVIVTVATEAIEEVEKGDDDDVEEELEVTAEVRVVNVERPGVEVELLRALLLLLLLEIVGCWLEAVAGWLEDRELKLELVDGIEVTEELELTLVSEDEIVDDDVKRLVAGGGVPEVAELLN